MGPSWRRFLSPCSCVWVFHPELTQAAYRIGDSSTNIIAPLMPFFVLTVAFFQKYDRDAGIRERNLHHASVFRELFAGMDCDVHCLVSDRSAPGAGIALFYGL